MNSQPNFLKGISMNNRQNDEILEIWDWESGKPTGKPAPRSECHKNGIPHEGVHLWIVNDRDSERTILFQLRAPHKEMYPDVLDITVGGHVPYGLLKNKIQKEAFEEIGIRPEDNDLIDLGYYRYEEKEKDYFHREFQRIYILKDNRLLSDYTFTDGEVSAIYAVPYPYLKKIMLTDLHHEVSFYNGEEMSSHTISKKKFHPLLFAPSMKEYMELLFSSIDSLQ